MLSLSSFTLGYHSFTHSLTIHSPILLPFIQPVLSIHVSPLSSPRWRWDGTIAGRSAATTWARPCSLSIRCQAPSALTRYASLGCSHYRYGGGEGVGRSEAGGGGGVWRTLNLFSLLIWNIFAFFGVLRRQKCLESIVEIIQYVCSAG